MSTFTLRSLAATLTESERSNGCIAYDPNPDVKAPTYGYQPNLAAGIIFTVVFFLSMFVHVYQTWRSRKWWYSALVLGALGEGIGWVGRAVAHHCPYSSTYFSLQISILIISPCFFSAAIYYLLGQMIRQYGRQYSFIGPNLYLGLFIGSDLLSIIIQAVGGGLASSAGGKTPPEDTAPGTHTMLAGIIIQLISMSTFAVLWLIFLWRARSQPISKILIFAGSFSTSLIMIRNFYRAVELGQGWEGYLITHEVYFDVLDATLMVFAVVVFNIFHPTTYVTGEPGGQGAKSVGDHEMA